MESLNVYGIPELTCDAMEPGIFESKIEHDFAGNGRFREQVEK